jgi:hypothetical protein
MVDWTPECAQRSMKRADSAQWDLHHRGWVDERMNCACHLRGEIRLAARRAAQPAVALHLKRIFRTFGAGWRGTRQVWYVGDMNQRVDLVRNSLPSSNELVLETIGETEDGIVFRALTKRLSCCPAFLQSRVSYHSHYVSECAP